MTDTLQASLSASFTKDGFVLDGAIGGLGKLLEGVNPAFKMLDVTAINGALDLLKGADFSSIGQAVDDAASGADGLFANLPDAGSLLTDLSGTLTKLADGLDPEIGKMLKQVEAAASGIAERLRREATSATDIDVSQGAARLAQIFDVVAKVASNPLLALVLVAFAHISGKLTSGWKVFADHGAEVAAFVQSLGSLGGLDSLSNQALTLAQVVARPLDTGGIDAIVGRLVAASGDALAASIHGIDPNDAQTVQAAIAPILAFYAGVRQLAELVNGAFVSGLGALQKANVAGLIGNIEAQSAQLASIGVAAISELAKALRTVVDPVLSFKLPQLTPSDTGSAYLAAAIVRAANQVAQADPAKVAKPLTDGLAAALGGLHDIEAVVKRVTGAIESAIQAFATAASKVDLTAAAQTLRKALRPVADALASVDGAITAAQNDIKQVATDVENAMASVEKQLIVLLKPIRDAFDAVGAVLRQANLDQVVAALRSAIGDVATVLRSAPLQPFFEKAVSILNTGADILSAVPKSILPAAVKQELDDACSVIQDIDFTGVTKSLTDTLDSLVTDLGGHALDEIDALYKELVAFLEAGPPDGINPRPLVADFETKYFDKFVDRLNSVDPTQLLAPVEVVLNEVRAKIGSFDPKALLAPIDAVFDKLEAGFAKLDPNALLAPLVKEAADVRAKIQAALPIDGAVTAVTKADQVVADFLGKLDPAKVLPALDGIFDGLVGGIRELACETGQLAGSLRALLSGISVDVPLASLGSGWKWVFGGDGAAAMSDRVHLLSQAVESALQAVNRLDFTALTGDVVQVHKAILAEVNKYPPGSELHRQLDPVLASSDPAVLFSGFVSSRAKHTKVFNDALGALRHLEGSAWSQITVVAEALREALRPLAAVPERLRALLGWLGADVSQVGLAKAVNDLLGQFRPSVLLAPLAAELVNLRTKVAAVIHNGLMQPVITALHDVSGLIDLIDVPVPKDLEDLFHHLADGIKAFRPCAVLGDTLAAVEKTIQTLVAFDPLQPVKDFIDKMKKAVADLVAQVRPSVLFEPILGAYDSILHTVEGLDIRALLQPVLDALNDLEQQLSTGLTDAATALERLKDSCKSPGGLSVHAKVTS